MSGVRLTSQLWPLVQCLPQMFPGLTTRRLGTRGQSRYHYYGLAVGCLSLIFFKPANSSLKIAASHGQARSAAAS